MVAFFGPDGSGKSTLAKALALELRRRGFRAKVSWMRGTHTISSLLAMLLSRFRAFRGLDNPYYGISLPSHARRVWQLIEFVSLLPILLTRFILPQLLGYLVIAERYLPDFLAWVSLTTNDNDYLRRFEAMLILALSMKADVCFYITASKAELLKRRVDVGEELLDRQLKHYDRLARLVAAHRIDTTEMSVEEALAGLLKTVQVKTIGAGRVG